MWYIRFICHFFVLTGYVSAYSYNSEDFFVFYKKKNIALMKPYFLYAVLLLAFKSFKNCLSGNALSGGNINCIINTILITRKSFISELWFLPCLLIAQNYAVDIAKGELFASLDSDDYIIPNALEIIWNEWNSISLNEKEQYSGIGVHCSMNSQGELIGDAYPNDHFVSNDLDISFKYHIKGEKWGVIRADIMKQFKNEEVKGHFYRNQQYGLELLKNTLKSYIY